MLFQNKTRVALVKFSFPWLFFFLYGNENILAFKCYLIGYGTVRENSDETQLRVQQTAAPAGEAGCPEPMSIWSSSGPSAAIRGGDVQRCRKGDHDTPLQPSNSTFTFYMLSFPALLYV